MSDDGQGTERPASVGRRAARLGRRIIFVVLAACWILLTWRALQPPVAIPLPPYEPEGMVFVGGGRLPTTSSFAGERVGDFWMDRFEVTNARFAEFLAANPDEPAPHRWTSRAPPFALAQRPVVHVDLHQARRFARWRGGRIPTVQEWEWAALGALGVEYPWGIDAASVRANVRDAGFGRAVDVGFFVDGMSRSTGCFDMVGNVAEWTDTAVSPIDGRHYIRGGSYADPMHLAIVVGVESRQVDRNIMTTHEDEFARVPIWDRLAAPSEHSSLVGLRCVMAGPAIQAQRDEWTKVAELIQELGCRDPISLLLYARPAADRIREIGSSALPVLRAAKQRVRDDGVGERIDGLIDELSVRAGAR